MRTYIIEDASGQQFEIEAESPKDAVKSHCHDAAAVDYLFTDSDSVKWFAAFDENGEGIEDVMVWEALSGTD